MGRMIANEIWSQHQSIKMNNPIEIEEIRDKSKWRDKPPSQH